MQAKLFQALHHSNSPGKYVREDKYFGVILDVAVEQSLAPLPAPVPFLCEYIEKCGLSTEGLFRIAGNKTKIDAIVEAFKHESKVVLDDVHDATGALKAFFRQMPEPLIPFPHYEGFVAVGEMEGEKQKLLLQDMISSLPRNHVNLLRYLVLFLQRIALRANVNMMSEANLAIVFGPNLIRPEVEDTTLTHKHTGLINKVFSSMIVFGKEVFPPEEATPEILELTKKMTQMEKERNAMQSERNRVNLECSQLTEERNTITQERNKLKIDLEGMHSCLSASLTAVASVQREKEAIEKAKIEAVAELTALKQTVSELRQNLSELQSLNSSEQSKREGLQERLTQETAALTADLARVKEEAEAEREEHKKSLQELQANKRETEEKTSSAILMEGVLSKRSKGLPHRWQKRQCTLTVSMLYWLSGDGDSSKSKAAMACVFMSEVVSVEDLGAGGQPAFTIQTRTKTGVMGSFTFAAPTALEREKWIASINHNSAIAKSTPPTPRNK